MTTAKPRPHLRLNWLFLLLLLLTVMFFSNALRAEPGFFIKEAETRLVDKVHMLQLSLEYEFSEPVLEAIESGVPMVVLLDIRVYKYRRFWMNKEVASLKQRFRLHYQALVEQYVVKNINSGAQYTARTLHSALYGLRDIKNLPLIDHQLLDASRSHEVELKVSIEFDSLPVPLKLSAYTSRKWWLGSAWHSIPMN